MTNYHLKPPQSTPPYSAWKEAREKRRKVLAEVRARRREIYKKFLAKEQSYAEK